MPAMRPGSASPPAWARPAASPGRWTSWKARRDSAPRWPWSRTGRWPPRAWAALQHPGHHAEESRLLRPHLRRDRRDAGHPRPDKIDAAQVESIRVDTYQTALDVTGNFDPRTAFEAKFSLPYVVSHALLYGAVRLNAFEPAAPGRCQPAQPDGQNEADRRPPAERRISRHACRAGDRRLARRPGAGTLRALPQGRPGSAADRCRPERQVRRTRVPGHRSGSRAPAAGPALADRAARPRPPCA